MRKYKYCASLVFVVFALIIPCQLYSQTIFTAIKDAFTSSSDDNTSSDDIFELTIDENLETPVLGKQSDAIREFQEEQARALKKELYNTELMRNNEVIVVTIPCDKLFLPNDTILAESAGATLRPFLKFLKTPGLYKIIIAAHSDDTGTENYTFNISKARVEAVYNWFDNKKASIDNIVPYALGNSDPVLPNNSMMNRKQNRRIEIYLVPGKTMIQSAKKGGVHL